MKILLLISYNGSNYYGFQKQPNQPNSTIQEIVEFSLTKLYQANIKITGSGRTDRGVHADEQVVTFIDQSQISEKITIAKLPEVINHKLPNDIRVLVAKKVNMNFHPRFQAKVRWYRYNILSIEKNQKIKSINLSHFLVINYHLNLTLLRKCFSIFIGNHDFTTFCSAQDSSKNKHRTIYQILVGHKERVISIDLFANAFLHGMVRSLIGNTLYLYQKTQKNNISKKDILIKLQSILDLKNPTLAKHRAPSRGLVLKKVFYQSIFK